MELGCTEFAVPGETLEEKLGVLESHGMWLELVNDGEKRARNILEVQQNFITPIKSVQAYLQHEKSMLSRDSKEREEAIQHVEESIRLASEIGAKNVVVILTYGDPGVKNPREKSVELLEHFSELGEELDVIISIEPLGQAKTTFLPSAFEVFQLIQEVGSEYVRLMIDTMHVHSNNQDPAEVIGKLTPEISEIQLRDTNSKPPGQGDINFDPVMEILCEKFKGLLCLEYRSGPDPRADFANAHEFTTRFWKS